MKGAYAERAVVPADRAVRIPDGVTTKQAAAVWLQGLTAHYLSTSTFPLSSSHHALVHAAAGGVGLLLCQMAKKRGAFVIGTASTAAKRQLAHEAGADEMIDYTSQNFAEEARRITNNVGVDVVYDSVGRTTFDGSLDCAAAARHARALRPVERSGDAVRSADAQPQGIALPHEANAE